MALDHAFYFIVSFCIRSIYHLSNIDWWTPCKPSLWLHCISWKNHTLSAFHMLDPYITLSFMQQSTFISRIVLHSIRLTRIFQTSPYIRLKISFDSCIQTFRNVCFHITLFTNIWPPINTISNSKILVCFGRIKNLKPH